MYVEYRHGIVVLRILCRKAKVWRMGFRLLALCVGRAVQPPPTSASPLLSPPSA